MILHRLNSDVMGVFQGKENIKDIWDNQRHSTVSREALKSESQVTVLVDCVKLIYKMWVFLN